MNLADIKITILTNLFTGAFFFFLGLFWPKLRCLNKPLVRWFFGKAVFKDNFILVHGSIIDSRVGTAQPGDVRFVKQFHDGRKIGISGP